MNKVNNFMFTVLNKNPFHIAKRGEIVWWKAWIIRIVAVLMALVVCGVITVALTAAHTISLPYSS